MARIDAAAKEQQIDSFGLMTAAGCAVAASALAHFPGARRFAVLCGPGNNGGDGYIAARALTESGAALAVFSSIDPAALTGDACQAQQAYGGDILPLADYEPASGDVIVDALFGAGLSRTLQAGIIRLIGEVHALDLPVLAIDLPSGVSGHTGTVLGAAFQATRTVTFMCRKPGHLLMPGRELCGELDVVDIGIPSRIVVAHAGAIRHNSPALWASALAKPDPDTHKYKRGHLVVFSGGANATGAARMTALAGLKTGAGLVTVASPRQSLDTNAAHLTGIMLRKVDGTEDLSVWLDDARLGTFVLGPAFGIGEKARDFVRLLAGRKLVLDADGISSFRDHPDVLFEAFSGGETRLVLTPHEGEFARLFPDIATDLALSKVEKAVKAAARANAAIIYKGADTVIACPGGRAAINSNAPPWLATAGSGDVLAGIVGGLLAQGLPAFEAAAAAVWMHGEAASRAGTGLIAEDLPEHIIPL